MTPLSLVGGREFRDTIDYLAAPLYSQPRVSGAQRSRDVVLKKKKISIRAKRCRGPFVGRSHAEDGRFSSIREWTTALACGGGAKFDLKKHGSLPRAAVIFTTIRPNLH
jgi:hypothetical protein